MSTRAIRISLAVLAVLLAGFITLVVLTEKSPRVEELREHIFLDVTESDIEYYHDSHGGFFGDGEAVAVFRASEENAFTIKKAWSNTFCGSRAVLDILYGKGGVFENHGIFPPKNGFFFYKNTGSGFSQNFIFAVFDQESSKVYYCRFDT